MDAGNKKRMKNNSQEQKNSGKHYSTRAGGNFYKGALLFMTTLKKDYKRLVVLYNSCLKEEQERERQNKVEIDKLKKIYNQMQMDNASIKRRFWCRYCESEATYLSSFGTNSYCSEECEQKQKEFVSALKDEIEL